MTANRRMWVNSGYVCKLEVNCRLQALQQQTLETVISVICCRSCVYSMVRMSHVPQRTAYSVQLCLSPIYTPALRRSKCRGTISIAIRRALNSVRYIKPSYSHHGMFTVLNTVLIKATPTIVEEAFIFYLWTFFCNAAIQPRDDVAEPRQKYISG